MASRTYHVNRRGFLVLAAAAVAAACTRDRSAPPVPEELQAPPRVLGYSTGSSILWADDADVSRTMAAVRDGGATSVRIDISWRFAEPARGQYDWRPSDRVVDAARAAGLDVVATLTTTPAWAAIGFSDLAAAAPRNPQEYGAFAGVVADRYRGRVSTYEIWNEPNGRLFFWPNPDPARYTAMLRSAFTAVTASDPDAVVVAGALGNTDTTDGRMDSNEFLVGMYDAGAAGSFHALSYHAYDYGTTLADAGLYPNSAVQQIIRMRQTMVTHGDAAARIWITEYGAPDTGVDADTQARLIVESAQQWGEVPYGGPFYVYTVRDGDSLSSDPEARFGVLDDAFVPKPVYGQLAALAAAGLPQRDIANRFDAAAPSDLGEPWGPVFALPAGSGRQYTHGSLYSTASGWLTSPPAVADIARTTGLVPAGPFHDGYQDLLADGGFRVFSDPRFGTWAVVGAILDQWRPELGFPVTGEYEAPDGQRVVDFESGRILWNPTDGAVVVRDR
ncbi:cellulase family glycosylhydrolase [Rhodococcus sp. MEB041]|uniref:cellulase family glycosylhydrolase n=1 Tax=Rhodococcus sp. MEB041 TaxID=3040323 RepID=UPI00254FE110|nr:cellulase family glycosylhydrolase [Rhodococcus sp. MEB041]